MFDLKVGIGLAEAWGETPLMSDIDAHYSTRKAILLRTLASYAEKTAHADPFARSIDASRQSIEYWENSDNSDAASLRAAGFVNLGSAIQESALLLENEAMRTQLSDAIDLLFRQGIEGA